jgi:hypothetical protein
MRADEKMDDALSPEEKQRSGRTLRALEKGFADIETEADAARRIDKLEGISVPVDEGSVSQLSHRRNSWSRAKVP